MMATFKCWMYWAKLSKATAVRHMKVKLAATLIGRVHGITNRKNKTKQNKPTTPINHVLQSILSPEYMMQAYHFFGSYTSVQISQKRGLLQWLLSTYVWVWIRIFWRYRGHREETTSKQLIQVCLMGRRQLRGQVWNSWKNMLRQSPIPPLGKQYIGKIITKQFFLQQCLHVLCARMNATWKFCEKSQFNFSFAHFIYWLVRGSWNFPQWIHYTECILQILIRSWREVVDKVWQKEKLWQASQGILTEMIWQSQLLFDSKLDP